MAQILPANANDKFPYDRLTQPKHHTGDSDDSARYIKIPGTEFVRPWLMIPGGAAFIWPGGIEGFTCRIDPTLGVHRYIGDNAVVVDVTHKGQESIILAGTFPGLSSVDAFLSLRDLIYQDIPDGGFILFVPFLYPKTQRVFVQSANFDHPQDSRLRDLSYSIEFLRVNVGPTEDEALAQVETQTSAQAGTPSTESQKGKPARSFTVTASVNTLRKIAKAKLGNANKWDQLYRANEKFFKKHNVAMHAVPDYRLPQGTKIGW